MIRVTKGCGGSDFGEGRENWHLIGDVQIAVGQTVTPTPSADGAREWLVTGYRETRDFLRDGRFSRALLSDSCYPRGPALRMSITEMDPPQHTRIRNLVGGAFSVRRVEHLRPRIEQIADRLLHRLINVGPTADLLRDFCAPLAFAAQCELLGVPASRRESIRLRSVERLGWPGARMTDRYLAELRLHAEVTDMIADHQQPPAGLLAGLITAHRDQQVISEIELTGLAASLFFDGHALAAAQIANAVLCLLMRPERLGMLREDPSLLDGAVEESVRYSPSVNFSMSRIATTDLVLGGMQIRAADRVTAVLPLANRDDTAFVDPCHFDIGRATKRHLTFGYGTHHCIGAHLARVEMLVALRALLRRAPGLHLAVSDQDLTWFVSPTIRSLSALPVRWHR